MNHLERTFSESPEASRFARRYLDYLSTILAQLDEEAIVAFIGALVEARERDASIFFVGNGGSAATASHFANDIAIGCRSWHKPFRAVSLTDNMPIITAIANDYGYEHIFTYQLKTVMKSGDVVVAISASGNSPNVVNALEYANQNGAVSIALTGFDGGKLRQVSQINVHVPTEKGEYGPVEDIHMVLDHLVGAFLMYRCRGEVAVGV
ncbi:MAG TPA: SIS domain-containing protein [Thermoanaerobaculia bacterium]|nr:SIS domain-containing protein [Thermoanaerobaculia bacterium]